MKEVYIIGFTSKKTGKKTYSTVIGIGATRKMSSNKGTYSYLDDTPRAAAHQEIVKQYGEDSEEERDNLVSICKLKGDKGNEAIGFGLWPKDSEPYGVEKGNTKRNMANIRSERQAHDRLSGTSLPRGVEVIDEAYVDAETIGKVDRATGEITDGEFKEVGEESKAEEKPKANNTELMNLSIKNLGELFSACHKHFGLNQSAVLEQLGGITKDQIADVQDAWRQIVEARK